MPIYEYRCSKCGRTFEEISSISQSREVTCPACGSENTKRVLSAFSTTGCGLSGGHSSCGTKRNGFS